MRTWATAIAVIACVLVAAGCASSGAKKSTIAVSPGSIPPTRTVINGHPVVLPISPKSMRGINLPESARFLSPTRLAIGGIAGTSNCPSVPKKLSVESPHHIRIDLAVGSWGRTPAGGRLEVPLRPRVCLSDLHPVPVVIAIDPAQIDVHHSLKVSLYYPSYAVPGYRRLVVDTALALASRSVRQEVQIARDSNSRLFSIFPAVPGEVRCAIPDGGPIGRTLPGICRTSVHSRPTMEPSWSVNFTEIWVPCPPGADCPAAERTVHHTWQVGEGETVVTARSKPRVYGTRSRGAEPPQYYK